MSSYSEKLKDPRWQRKRLEVLHRDDFTCLDCGDNESTLHVHHCLYISSHEPWDYENDELRTLCETCHDERHSIEHDVKLEFQRLMALLSSEQLSELMVDILAAKTGDTVNGIRVLPSTEIDWQADARWYFSAIENKEMRPFYEAMVQYKAFWPETTQ